ncbi:hypothetical protein PVNG_06005 [Plasmodium vivax North Korean]|uniref:Uncharacterized protein n=1 Tax=Plasmodium vivax North Korean TaxID=1035514 RepID=A0A0J9U044_PLAVI|nr:hypothetical protein PVNG_06005 [Plasmodium vivax North Korean]
MAQTYHDNCEYYKKIKEMSSVYKDYEGKCSTKRDDCPEFFHKFHKENHEHILENLPCYKKMEQGRVAEAKAEDRSSDHHSGSERRPGASDGDYRSQGSEHGASHTETTTENSGIGNKVTHTVLGAAPVLLTATALYRVCTYLINISL